jgi:hypothetical protein
MAALIGLPPKGAGFCHTSNRLLVGVATTVPYCRCILIPLQSVVDRWLVGLLVGWSVGWLVGWSVGRLIGQLFGWLVGRSVGWSVSWSVQNKGSQASGVSLQKEKISTPYITNFWGFDFFVCSSGSDSGWPF